MIVLHLILAAGIILFPYYRIGAIAVFSFFPHCVLHDVFHIYCPLCGGTRALDETIHFRLGEAFRFHPLIPLFAGIALVYYVFAWIRLFRGKTLLAPIPKALSVTALALLIGYWILRNVLLIGFGIDPAGDLASFWN